MNDEEISKFQQLLQQQRDELKAALQLAQLGRPVKKLIGGVTGWIDEGFSLICDTK